MPECELCDAIDNDKPKPRPKLTKIGKIILGISAASFCTMCAVATPFLLPAVRKVCLPYVPASTEQVKNVMTLLQGRSGRMVDLGSGDGRLVIGAAKRGFKSEGIELNPWLVLYSKLSARRQGQHLMTKFYTKDLWKHDLSKYDNIVVFGVDTMMPQLEVKLSSELGGQSQVVACRFPFKNWTPSKTVGEGIDTVWLYKRPLDNVQNKNHK